jgi:hypothetical protein
MKKSIVLYSISVLMFCFGVYLEQYECWSGDDSTVLNLRNFCTWDTNSRQVVPLIYSATFIFLSIFIAVVTFIKQDDL